jgi:hypothetical protein
VLTDESEASSPECLPTVDPSEIAFAMVLFVAAARRSQRNHRFGNVAI